MRIRTLGFLCAGVALSLAMGSATAQKGLKGQKGQGKKAGHFSLATIPVDAIDSVAHLTGGQKAQITAIHDKYESEARALRPAKGSPPDPANRQKMADLRNHAGGDIEAVLTAEQKDKLKAAAREMGALRGTGLPPALAMELKLTEDQKTKIASIINEEKAKAKNGTPRKEIMQEARTRVEAILTPDQKAAMEKYMRDHGKKHNKKAKP